MHNTLLIPLLKLLSIFSFPFLQLDYMKLLQPNEEYLRLHIYHFWNVFKNFPSTSLICLKKSARGPLRDV